MPPEKRNEFVDKLNIELLTSKELANPKNGDEVVISGISGKFPDSDNIYEFQENLFNKVDLVTDDDRRWSLTHPEIPKRTGKIFGVTKFDAGFFGVHNKQAISMDPMIRILYEKTYECILDAGINPKELKGKNVGVFVGACFSEAEKNWFYEDLYKNSYGLTGCIRSVIPQRISYWLGIHGPSYVVDSACSSSLYAFEHAYRAIRNNQCDSAFVAGTNTCLHPYVSLQFSRLGVLSKDGKCKSFDEDADGYARSETICIAYLQKAKNARRIYATVIHSKTNCDGYKDMGITFPSAQAQQILYEEIYSECNVDPKTVEYVEAHGTGTKVGDPEELISIDKIFCTGRNKPLPIGSVKSNIGHTEPSSGLASIAKVIIAMESGIIAPNINFNKARQDIEALTAGRLQVITEKQPWNGGLIGLNSFGFGGANCHVLLKWNEKNKALTLSDNDIIYPRLLCISGRNHDYIDTFFNDIKSNPVDIEQIKLLHEIHKDDIDGHLQRAYIMLKIDKKRQALVLHENRQPYYLSIKKKFILHLSNGIIANIEQLLNDFNKIEVFKQALTIIKMSCRNPENKNPNFLLFLLQFGLIETFKFIGLKFENISAKHCLGIALMLYYNKKISQKELFSLVDLSEENLYFRINSLNDKNKESISNDLNIDNNKIGIVNIEVYDPVYSRKVKTYTIDSLDSFLTNLGECYLYGANFKTYLLYPHIEYPVSRGTRMIAPFVRWNHDHDWFLTYFNIQQKISSGERTIRISYANEELLYLSGHIIDGRNLFPATAYLEIVWESIALMNGDIYQEISIVFEDVKFLRATHIPKNGYLDMLVMVHKYTGNFEIYEGGTSVVSGKAYIPKSELKFITSDLGEPTLPYEKSDDIKIMNSKNVYKELRLRGYNYQGMFRSIEECDISGLIGKVKWENRYVPFLDSLLQVRILQIDTRGTIIPTSIEKMTINVNKHIVECQEHNNLLPVYTYPNLRITRCGGVEIIGIEANIIPKRRIIAEPVLESYRFVPHYINDESYQLYHSIRNFVQIALENVSGLKVKSLEIREKDMDCLNDSLPILSEIISSSLGDLPLIQAEIYLYLGNKNSDLNLDPEKKINIITDRNIFTETNCLFIVLTKGMSRLNSDEFLNSFLNCLRDNAFIINRESIDYSTTDFNSTNYVICQEHCNGQEKLILLKKIDKENQQLIYKHIKNFDFSWISELQTSLQNLKKNEKLVILSENETLSGILGFVNCLKRELSSNVVRCIFIDDQNAPKFDPDLDFYKLEIKKGLSINVYQNGQWGTYRHLLLFDNNDVKTQCFHAYVNVTTRGDLSSLSWIQGPLSNEPAEDLERSLVYIQYSALNFRDIMTSTGRLSVEVLFTERLKQECVQGLEFSGVTENGKRVMGMVAYGALATVVHGDKYLLWEVPDDWTLEDAATVPIVYSTCIATLVMIARVQKNKSILIHAGSGGIGQAAIYLCLHYGLEIFTTVGTQEKRQFIRDTFPEIPDNHIGNSRDLSFEKMVMQETNGRGVDYVLNSLAEEKLQASVRCLAPEGKFLEIGKFDLAKNSLLSTDLLLKSCSFNTEVLDALFNGSPELKKDLYNLVQSGLNDRSIKPLKRTTFANNEVENAFRFMATGKHIGKVLIKIRSDEEFESDKKLYKICPDISCIPRFYPKNDNSVFIIIGGLGGFGLELADWLVLRGLQKIILTSRKGISNGYQSNRIKLWRSYGIDVRISTIDVTIKDNCIQLIKFAQELGYIEGIFNLAVVLRDAVFENQTVEDFETSLKPKAFVTKYLDEVTRELCPNLKYFVVFSSVSCGRGNAGQTNYGMANSIMERICEQRIRDGYHALAIEWGAIGEVGLVADMQDNNLELEIGGTLQQRITSCLETLDLFLLKANYEPIVSSMVVAEKKTGTCDFGNVVDTVAYIMGIKDLKNISLNSTLAELGMDSMMAVEIKQTLERDFEIFLTAQDIRSMTFGKLIEMSASQESDQNLVPKIPMEGIELAAGGLQLLFRTVGDEQIAKQPLIKLQDIETDDNNNNSKRPIVFYLPGIEGMAAVIEPLANKIPAINYCLQLPYNIKMESVEDMSNYLLPYVTSILLDSKTFIFVAYSYGATIALDLSNKLEERGLIGKIVSIDGSPFMMKRLYDQRFNKTDEIDLQLTVISSIIGLYATVNLNDYKAELNKEELTYAERIDIIINHAPKVIPHSKEHQKNVCVSIYDRIKIAGNCDPTYEKSLKSSILLIKPSEMTVQSIDEDYEISKLLFNGNSVNIVYVSESDHTNILEKDMCANYVNNFIHN